MSRGNYHLYALITIFFWALAFVLTRLGLEYFSVFALGFLRHLIAVAVLIIVAVIMKIKPPRGADWLWFLLAGFLGFFIYMILFNTGMGSVNSATGSVVIATTPVITAVFARILYKEKLRLYQWIAVFIEFVGVVILALMNSRVVGGWGLLWLLLAAVCFSGYNLLQRRLTKSYTALQASIYSLFCGTLLMCVFAPGAMAEFGQAPPIQYLYLIVLGVCCTSVAYVAWSKAFVHAEKTSQVSNYMFLTPFVAGLMGFVIAAEVPGIATVLGGGVILTGVFIFNFGDVLLAKLPKKNW